MKQALMMAGSDHDIVVLGPKGVGKSTKDLNGIREQNFGQELEALHNISQILPLRPSAPVKLLIGVAKADLWWEEREAAQRRYDVTGDSAFSDGLRRLQASLGSQSLTIEVRPLVTWSEDYV